MAVTTDAICCAATSRATTRGARNADRNSRNSRNSRNGNWSKTVLTDVGPVETAVPRDTDGSFEPQLVNGRQRRLAGVDEMVLSLSEKGLTHGEISADPAEVYGASDEAVRATSSTLPAPSSPAACGRAYRGPYGTVAFLPRLRIRCVQNCFVHYGVEPDGL
jgi:hypothetical protein